MRSYWAIAGLVVVAATVMREMRLSAFEQHLSGQKYEDRYYLPSASWLPAVSLGYRQALADVIWCKSLVYFGDELVHGGHVEYVFEYTDAILALDPSFRSAYRWVATAAIYRPVDVTIGNGLWAARYLERAVTLWPNDGELHWDYGSLLRFELAPLEKDKARKLALLEKAAPQLEMAAMAGAGPPWLGLNNADLLNRLGRTEQAIRHLEELSNSVKTDAVQAEIALRLAALRAQAYVESSRVADEQFEREHQAAYPYLDASLFLLLGEQTSIHDYTNFVFGGFFEDYLKITSAD